MHKLMTGLAVIGLLGILAGCNSTDALTPQVDVGGGFNSPPVTQTDLDRMSAEAAPATTSQQTAFSAAGQNQTSFSSATPATGTLEAQADALARNGQPIASATQAQANTTAERAVPAETQGESAALTPSAAQESVRFLPIIGAPVQAVTPLSRKLGAVARAQGIAIRSASDNSTRYILKGYFSAMNDNGKTTVVYVWDVLDGSGARLHRIQGQDTVSGTASDPWAAVPARTMENIAEKTIREYLDWRGQSRG